MINDTLTRLRRGLQIGQAFLGIGFSTAASYPITFIMSAIRPLIPVVTFFFVAKLVRNNVSVGGDYFTFTVIGFLVTEALAGALGGFTHEMQFAVHQGRFEMLLVEPVRWRFLPFGLATWPIISHAAFSGLAATVAFALGARISWSGLLPALSLFLLAIGACLAIGVLSGAIGVLSKRSDPVLILYTLIAGILSGVAFPIDLLPTPVRALSWFVPHTYVITGLRNLLLPEGGTVAGPSVSQAFLALAVFNAVMYPIVLWAFGRIMNVARRFGVLSGY